MTVAISPWLTQHAIERLRDRYGYTKSIDVNYIVSRFSTKEGLQIIRTTDDECNEYMIRYSGRNIRAVVDTRSGAIRTFLPEKLDKSQMPIGPVENISMSIGEYSISFDKLYAKIRKVEKYYTSKIAELEIRIRELEKAKKRRWPWQTKHGQ